MERKTAGKKCLYFLHNKFIIVHKIHTHIRHTIGSFSKFGLLIVLRWSVEGQSRGGGEERERREGEGGVLLVTVCGPAQHSFFLMIIF